MRTTSKSPTTTKDGIVRVHPGEILAEEFIIPYGLTVYRVALDIGVPPPRVNDIVLQKRGITAQMALRFAKYFGVSPEFWMNLQAAYDLRTARHEIASELARVPVFNPNSATKVVRPRLSARSKTSPLKGKPRSTNAAAAMKRSGSLRRPGRKG